MVGAILRECSATTPATTAYSATPTLSVVVCTYQNPYALDRVLACLERQTFRGFEILVADDGSASATAETVAAFAAVATVPVVHLWQADIGPRKCTIQNRAILTARASYLVLLDGDCLLPRHALALHHRLRRPRRWLAGGSILLGAEASAKLDREAIHTGMIDGRRAWAMAWRGKRSRRLLFGLLPGVARLADLLPSRHGIGWRGGHSSAWRDDLLAVGGFDERLGLGLEDKDLARRLRRHGLRGISIRHRVPMFHLDHERPASRAARLESNRRLLEADTPAASGRTAFGISEEAAQQARRAAAAQRRG